MGCVTEAPAEGDVGHRAAVGPLEVLQAAREPLVAHEAGDRRVDVLEQGMQRAHGHRVCAGDRRWTEVGVLEMRADVAADLGPDRIARRGATGRQLRLDRRSQKLERRVGGGHACGRLELRQLERERVHVADQQARGTAAGHRRQRGDIRQPRAESDHVPAREQQCSLVERLHDLDLGRLHPVPEHHVAGLERQLTAALAHELDALADELEPEHVLVGGGVVRRRHHGLAAIAQKW